MLKSNPRYMFQEKIGDLRGNLNIGNGSDWDVRGKKTSTQKAVYTDCVQSDFLDNSPLDQPVPEDWDTMTGGKCVHHLYSC